MTDYLRRTRHTSNLEGTATHADDEGNVWVRLDGLGRAFRFDPEQLELMPGECHVG